MANAGPDQSLTLAGSATAGGGATVFPIPSRTGQFSLQLSKAFQGKVSYSLVSVLGARVSSGTLLVHDTDSLVPLDFSKQMAADGMYYLLLTNGKAQARIKLIKGVNGTQ